MTHSTQVLLSASVIAILLGSCAPIPDRAPTAAASSTAPPSPSPTSAPTSSPTLPPRPTVAPTVVPASPPTPAGPELDCKRNWQSPANGTKLEPRTDFTVRWNVTNTGTTAWEPDAVDLVYAAGTRMYFQPVAPLPARVAPGESATLSVDMKALRNTSGYVTTWTLRRGDTYFCKLDVMILVQWFEGLERNW